MLPQHPRSITPQHGGHPVPRTDWWLPGLWGYWQPYLSPPAPGAPVLGGYRVIPQINLFQSIPRRNIACCILPQRWDQTVPCHRMRRWLLIHPCSQTVIPPSKQHLAEPAVTRPLERHCKTCKKLIN